MSRVNGVPKCKRPQFDFIPDDLKEYPQWVLWGYEWSDVKKKYLKIPYSSVPGVAASTTNPLTWWTYESIALNFHSAGDFDGIGFVLTRDCGIVAIDIDDCVTWESSLEEEGKPIFDDWALAIINKLVDVYIEFSPSRKGLRILVKGAIERNRRFDKCGIEFYCHSQYVTITGDVYNAGPIEDKQAELDEMLAKLDSVYSNSDNQFDGERRQPKRNSISVEERLKIAFASENGAKIKALFDGDLSEFEDSSPDGFDRSAADFSLCRLLAFYSDGEAVLLSEMMMQSALSRDKWYRNQYLEKMVDKILSTENRFYESSKVVIPKRALEKKNRYMLSELTDAALEYRRRSDIRGMEGPFKNLNKIYRPRPGLLSVWTGKPGAGKSTFILAYLLHFAVAHKIRLGICSFELNPPERVQLELVNIWSQACVFDESLDDEQYRENVNQLDDICTVFNLDFDQRSVFGIEPLIEKEIEENGLGIFYLDPFTELQPAERLLGKYTDFASQQLSALKEMTVNLSLMTHLVCHPTKQGVGRSKEELTLNDINGSGDFDRKADFGLVISREKGTDITVVHQQKVRDRLTGIEDGKAAFQLDQDAYYFKEVPVPIRLNTDSQKEVPF